MFSAAAQVGQVNVGQVSVSLVNNVRALIGLHNLAAADQEARAYRSRIGATPELAAALSWGVAALIGWAQAKIEGPQAASKTSGNVSQLLKGVVKEQP